VNAVAAQFENEQAPHRALGTGQRSSFGGLMFSHVRLQLIFSISNILTKDPSGFWQKLVARGTFLRFPSTVISQS
jgi:hypothetical protein